MEFNQDLLVIVLGVLVAIGMVAVTYLRAAKKGRALQLLQAVAPVFPVLFQRADVVLAQFGQQLKPANDIVEAMQPLVADDGWLAQKLSPPVLSALRELLRVAGELTDGVPLPNPEQDEAQTKS